MAKKNFHESNNGNAGGRQKCLNHLRKKLDIALETDLKRIFQDSRYCDLELVVDNESLFSHSCIVKTRAARFYSFITTECLVTYGTATTTVVIEQASTNYLRKFLENLYSSAFLPEAETYVLKYLENLRKHLILGSKDRLNHRSDPNLLSPESDKFFTPKSSPSELYKPFTLLTTSEEEISLSRSRNNASVRSYYRIVALDDIHGEEKKLENDRRNDSLEKELAEQDALFESLKFISSKEKVRSPAPQILIRRSTCKENKGPVKKLTTSTPKAVERLCKPFGSEDRRNKRKTPILPRLIIPKENYSMMDLSSSDPDSAVELSSAALKTAEVSTRNSSISETSGIDVTTESTASRCKVKSESPSLISPSALCEKVVSAEDDVTDMDTSTGTTVEVNHLKDEDIARLNVMETNMKDCEVFLDMERRIIGIEVMAAINTDGKTCQAAAMQMQSDSAFNKANDTDNYVEGVVGPTCPLNQALHGVIGLSSVAGLPGDSVCDMTGLSTPPCSPIVLPGDSAVPDIKDNDWACSSSKNCFIDASSLLDEDEIASPPTSLPPIKLNDVKMAVIVNKNVVEAPDISEPARGIDSVSERRQGELIFKNSIPHFSKHEVDAPGNSICSGAVIDDDSEQVVPVSASRELLQFVELASSVEPDLLNLSQSLPVTSYGWLPLGDEGSLNREDSAVEPQSFIASQSVPVDSSEIQTKAKAHTPVRKISAECMPIVSGGVSPRDYSSSVSHSSSPHLPRRHEQAPILSGGMDAVEIIKPPKRSQPSGDVWVVDIGDMQKPENRLFRCTSSESESDDFANASFKSSTWQAVKQLEPAKVGSSAEEEHEKPKSSFPLEKCASLGYFIDFGGVAENLEAPTQPKKHRNDSSNFKKNMFSMFIDLSDDSSASNKDEEKFTSSKGELCEKAGEEGNKETEMENTKTEKKPFYMFIETDSPVVKRKTSPGIPKLSQKRGITDDDKRALLGSNKTHKKIFSTSNTGTGPSSGTREGDCSRFSSMESEDKYPSLRDEPSPSSRVWASEEPKMGAHECWSASSDVQITYKDKMYHKDNGEKVLKKGSTFIIEGVSEPIKDSSDLQTLVEATPPKSPLKSPKPYEIDSGVVATEESDDSFVRLSDMDNTGKNPYIEIPKRRQSSRMSQSIPEGSWMEKKPSRIPEREKIMSKSIGSGGGKAMGSVNGDISSKSLSRLFPNLSSSTLSLFRQNGSNSGGRLEADHSELSMASEFSSMYSSTDQYGLEISTSETDVSCHANGASRLGQDLLRMFLEEISPDVVVEVGGRRIKAHKCILSSRCQFFAATLSGGWVESAGNVISLQGFSYSAVHFALCHIYSGESEIPDSLNMIELATLADILGLEGLKEVIGYTLRFKYCHSFHPPCPTCLVGVIDCLPVAATYGLDDLYRKCLRWITKFFVKVWPTKTFASLPKELLDKCFQYHLVHMTVENVLDTVMSIDKLRGALPSIRWAETVSKLANKLQDAATRFLADHFSSILTSDHFLAMGKDSEWSIDRVEKTLVEAACRLPAEQACWSHGRLHSLLSVATSPDPPPEMLWNENFILMLSNLSVHVQSSLIRQAPRAARSKAWLQMEPDLRSRIQEAACLVLPNDTVTHTSRRFPPKKDLGTSSFTGSAIRNNTRASDLRQFKLAMVQQASRTGAVNRRQQQISEHRWSTVAPKVIVPPPRRIEVRKSQSTSAVRETLKAQKVVPPLVRLTEVKSRYLEPRSPIKLAPEKPPASNVRKSVRGASSSDSSRNCSPAMARAANKKASQPPPKVTELSRRVSSVLTRSDTPSARALSHLTADDNMSTDSLATESSCGEREALIAKRQLARGKENAGVRKIADKVVPSLPRKTQSLSSFPSAGRPQGKMKTMIPRMDPDVKSLQGRRLVTQVRGPVAKGGSLSSPRSTTRTQSKTNANAINGNVVIKKGTVDSENNKTIESTKPPASVSRSGTFLKDEPTILKKPQVDV